MGHGSLSRAPLRLYDEHVRSASFSVGKLKRTMSLVSNLFEKTPNPNDQTLRGDILGGTVAGIVGLPLMLALGDLSGVGPIAGVWGAIILSLIVAILGGTPSMVSVPTPPMVVAFAVVFEQVNSDLSLVFPAVVLAGLMQIIFGALGLGQYIKLVPYPVISGFMSGIGVILIIVQILPLLGLPSESGTRSAIQALPDAVGVASGPAVLLGVITLVILFVWPSRLAQYIPGALVAVVVGTLAGSQIAFFDAVPTIGDIPLGFPEFTLPGFSGDTIGLVVRGAVTLAVLGSIDTLLTSLIADNLTSTRHASDRELAGQGVGNAIAALFGALPGAGATSITVVSMRSGGRGRVAAAVHSVVLLVIVLVAGPAAELIPRAVLAGILIKVGIDILDTGYLRRAHRGPRLDLVLMVVVLFMTVFVDLITAVAVGVVLAAIGFVKRLADQQLENFDPDTESFNEEEQKLLAQAGGRIVVIRFDGPLSFGAAADIGHEARERMHGETGAIVADFGRMSFVDMSAILAIEAILDEASTSRTSVFISRMNEEVQTALTRADVPEHFSFDDRQSAIEAASFAVFRGDPDKVL